MSLHILKFGGSSLRDPSLIRAAARRVAARHHAGEAVLVTVSAMGQETDELLALAPLVSSTASRRELDLLITSAEQKSVALTCLALGDAGVPAVGFTGAQAGIITDERFTVAAITDVRPTRLWSTLAAGSVPVVCGAQGVTTSGDMTFLGRGGSDTTAVALAAALDAELCELFTDVEGIFSADPRIVPDAQLLPELGHDQMLAMCRAGCPKPATRAVELARQRGVAIRVRPAFGEGEGSLIDAGGPGGPVAVISGASDRGEAIGRGTGDRAEISLVGLGPEHTDAGARVLAMLAAEGIGAGGLRRADGIVSCRVDVAAEYDAVRLLHAAFALPAPAGAEPSRRDRPDRRTGAGPRRSAHPDWRRLFPGVALHRTSMWDQAP